MYEQVLDRIMNKINLIPETQCWEWKPVKNSARHIQISIGSKRIGVRKFLYERHHRTYIKNFLKYKMACGNSICVNPEHMVKRVQEEPRESF